MRRPEGILVLLPVLNEVENAGPLLDRLHAAIGDESYVVCVVDDGSRDGTRDLLTQRVAIDPEHLHVIERTKTRRGSQRGGALHVALEWGLAHTDCDVFVEMDGDLSHRPEELPEALRRLRETPADVIVSSKFVRGSEVVNRPLRRRLVSRICSAAVWLFLSRAVSDYSNGYRFYTRRAAQIVSDTQIRYTSPIYLSEVLAVWLRNGLIVQEVPTTYIGRNEGLSKLRFTDLWKAAVAILEISLRYHLTGFTPRRRASASPEPRVEALPDRK